MPDHEPPIPQGASDDATPILTPSPKPRRRILITTSTIAAALAITTMLGTIVATFFSYRDSQISAVRMRGALRESDLATEAARHAESARREVNELRNTIASLRAALDKARQPSNSPQPYAELSPPDRHLLDEVKANQDRLQARLASLENALVATPEKALAVPMLRQQLDTIQERTRADIDSVHSEIGRLFALTQWFIGLMFTIALGVFGLALANLKRSDKGKLA